MADRGSPEMSLDRFLELINLCPSYVDRIRVKVRERSSSRCLESTPFQVSFSNWSRPSVRTLTDIMQVIQCLEIMRPREKKKQWVREKVLLKKEEDEDSDDQDDEDQEEEEELDYDDDEPEREDIKPTVDDYPPTGTTSPPPQNDINVLTSCIYFKHHDAWFFEVESFQRFQWQKIHFPFFCSSPYSSVPEAEVAGPY